MMEAEAKTKWCPFVRVQMLQPDGIQNPPINRPDGNTQCLGSACMAWRWYPKGRLGSETPTTGYCGIAGER